MTIKINDLPFEHRKKIGNRIKGARIMAGLNQEEFAEKYAISLSTLKNFEAARFAPRMTTVVEILDALNKEGVAIDENWLTTGVTVGSSQSSIPDTYTPNAHRSNESKVLLEHMTTQGLNPVITTIINDEMSPNYLRGDILIGLPVSKEDLVKQKIDSRGYMVESSGRFDPYFIINDGRHLFAVNGSKTMVFKIKNERLASIAWQCPASKI